MELALLFHRSDGKVDKHWYLSLTDSDKVNWVGRPDANGGNPEKGYYPVPPRGAKPILPPRKPKAPRVRISMPHNDDSKQTGKMEGLRKVFWELWGKRAKAELGLTDEEIEKKFQEW